MKRIVVLGGGGMKGLAHAGAWRAVRERQVEVAEIVGTSIGALVGAAVSAGVAPEALADRALSMGRKDIVTLNRWALLLNGIRQQSLFSGATFRAFIDSILPDATWDDLTIPVSINAVNLQTGEQEWFGIGGRTDVALQDAIYASCALPLFYPPAEIGGSWFVDGGIRDTLAIDRAMARGADLVIAVDATSGGAADPRDLVEKGMIAIHHRVVDIMATAHRAEVLRRWQGSEVLYVRPKLDGYSTFDFGHTRYFLDEGYRAMVDVLSEWGM